MFITIEGVDGAGKSTHLPLIAETLRRAGYAVCETREPGGTPVGESIRRLLLNDPMDARTEALLMFASRQEHLCRVISPALARGDYVVCDRFTDSSFAYQGGGRGLPDAYLNQLESMMTPFVTPDLTLFFDIDPERAAARVATGTSLDRFEREDLSFFNAVRDAYLRRIECDPTRFAVIDAGLQPGRGIEQVAQDVLDVLLSRAIPSGMTTLTPAEHIALHEWRSTRG